MTTATTRAPSTMEGKRLVTRVAEILADTAGPARATRARFFSIETAPTLATLTRWAIVDGAARAANDDACVVPDGIGFVCAAVGCDRNAVRMDRILARMMRRAAFATAAGYCADSATARAARARAADTAGFWAEYQIATIEGAAYVAPPGSEQLQAAQCESLAVAIRSARADYLRACDRAEGEARETARSYSRRAELEGERRAASGPVAWPTWTQDCGAVTMADVLRRLRRAFADTRARARVAHAFYGGRWSSPVCHALRSLEHGARWHLRRARRNGGSAILAARVALRLYGVAVSAALDGTAVDDARMDQNNFIMPRVRGGESPTHYRARTLRALDRWRAAGTWGGAGKSLATVPDTATQRAVAGRISAAVEVIGAVPYDAATGVKGAPDAAQVALNRGWSALRRYGVRRPVYRGMPKLLARHDGLASSDHFNGGAAVFLSALLESDFAAFLRRLKRDHAARLRAEIEDAAPYDGADAAQDAAQADLDAAQDAESADGAESAQGGETMAEKATRNAGRAKAQAEKGEATKAKAKASGAALADAVETAAQAVAQAIESGDGPAIEAATAAQRVVFETLDRVRNWLTSRTVRALRARSLVVKYHADRETGARVDFSFSARDWSNLAHVRRARAAGKGWDAASTVVGAVQVDAANAAQVAAQVAAAQALGTPHGATVRAALDRHHAAHNPVKGSGNAAPTVRKGKGAPPTVKVDAALAARLATARDKVGGKKRGAR